MPFKSLRNEFSKGATELLQEIATTPRHVPEPHDVDLRLLVGYASGTLNYDEAGIVEARAIENANLRHQLTQLIPALEGFKRIPYSELLSAQGSERENLVRREWLRIIDQHVHTATSYLSGRPPTRWGSLAQMAGKGAKGQLAAKTIWRALFSRPIQGTATDGLLRLGFGYRRSAQTSEGLITDLDFGATWSDDPSDVVTRFTGEVHENGDIEIDAFLSPETKAVSLFISYSMNGRTLALTETEIVDGRARAFIEGLGGFMRLPKGHLAVDSLSARTGGWPEQCEISQIVVESGPRRSPYLGLPEARNGILELTGYFEESETGGKWELSLAVSPNSWQVLRRFDIKGVIERPQVLTATLPATAKEGPFGGALLLKRLGPTIV